MNDRARCDALLHLAKLADLDGFPEAARDLKDSARIIRAGLVATRPRTPALTAWLSYCQRKGEPRG